MSLDDYTGIEDESKQHPLDFIRENLERIPLSMRDQDVIDKTIQDLNLTDIYQYMSQLKRNQDLSLKNLTIDYVLIDDLQLFAEICDYCGVNGVKYPLEENQRIYFIESSDFATTLIPIELDNETLNIYMEPLGLSPDLISKIFANLQDDKRDLAKEIREERIETLRRSRKKELALKEPWELD